MVPWSRDPLIASVLHVTRNEFRLKRTIAPESHPSFARRLHALWPSRQRSKAGNSARSDSAASISQVAVDFGTNSDDELPLNLRLANGSGTISTASVMSATISGNRGEAGAASCFSSSGTGVLVHVLHEHQVESLRVKLRIEDPPLVS